MNKFWKNTRFVDYEKKIHDGDQLRGLPSRPFPWLLIEQMTKDSDGDQWKFEILCTNLRSDHSVKHMLATIQVNATCIMEESRLDNLGFSLARLEWLELSANSLIMRSFSTTVKMKIENLDSIAKTYLEKVKNHVFTIYNSTNKIAQIKTKILDTPRSRFSPENHDSQ